jgi:hypothetical protein
MGNSVANVKARTGELLWRQDGNSTVNQAIASQMIPATQAAIGNSSNTILKQLTGGLIDLENLDHH